MDIQATSLNRVLACNGSIAMEVQAISTATPTEDAQEGTAAHHVAAAVLSGMITDPVEYVDRQTPNGIFVTPDMAEHVASYTSEIQSRVYDGDYQEYVETPMDFAITGTDIVIRARPDYIAFDTASGTLYVDNFKFGWRIVEPEGDWTALAYALGACFRFGWSPTQIVMTIHQPRPFHHDGPIRPWRISYAELMQYWAWLYTRLASLDSELHTGKHCHKCPALAICPAARMAGMNAVEASSVVFTDQVSDDALAFEWENLQRAQNMIEMRLAAIEELTMHRLENGRKVGELEVRQNFGHRTFKQGFTPEMVSAIVGKPVSEITTSKLNTPAALERAGVSEVVLAGITYRPPTSKKVVKSNPTRRADKLFRS